MFKITWDRKTGGILLKSHINRDTLSVSPRPVFWEELDMLGLDKMPSGKAWQYPHCSEPLLWACNKQYFYKGQFVFEAKGANIYEEATIILQPEGERLSLEPVDIGAMLEKNKEKMFIVENEALEFIRSTYIQYSSASKIVAEVAANRLDFEKLAQEYEKRTKQKVAIVKEDCDSFDIVPLYIAKEQGKRIYQTTRVDKFLASFSGGKDSQVVLDLVIRAIPPHAFEVIYSDTGYELPPSLKLYEEVQTFYRQLHPELKFSIARNHESVLHYWDNIGTPSDTHRWCCSVMKTAPLYRKLKIEGTNKQARVLTFDGVRSEESTRRSGYSRIGKGVKHGTVINASPILNWNTSEIYLYLFKYNLLINPAYRQGMTRIGCLICPFSSEWNDMISNKCFTNHTRPFLSRIEKLIEKSGIKDKDEYIKTGNWKRRAGGRGISFRSYMEIVSTKPNLTINITSPQKNPLVWLQTVCEYNFSEGSNSKGEIRYKDDVFSFSLITQEGKYTIQFENTGHKPALQGLLKRALYKATYCINCESCDVECPTGALSILPDITIDKKTCTRCHKCLLFHDYGCVVASSLAITGNNFNNKNNMKLISYNNFGLKGEWFDEYIHSLNAYFKDGLHGLNTKEQLPNFVKWLVQADILNDTKNREVTELGKVLSEVYTDSPDLVWEIIWINLSYNSPIAKWYKENIEWNSYFTEAEIRELVRNDYPTDSPTTIKNVIYALFRTFRESPIGDKGQLVNERKLNYLRRPSDDICRESIAYSFYKYAEMKESKTFKVSDLYKSDNKYGIYKEFGISKNELLNQLRSLNSDNNRVLVAELNMGLEHITLRDDLNALEAIKILTR